MAFQQRYDLGDRSSVYSSVTGVSDNPSFYELHSLPSQTHQLGESNDYDAAKLLDHNRSTKCTPQTTKRSSRRKRLIDISKAIVRSDKWKYVNIHTYLAEPAESQNHFRGWRKAVIAAAMMTGLVLVINLVFAIVAAAKFGATNGVGVLYTGDCNVVKRWDTALHLLINLLGTCLLAASSFTMQCLSSPTRSEADAAHALNKSMDIGIPSFKNLFSVNRRKAMLWWALCLSTIPLHLLWNSTVFSTLGVNEHSYFIVDETFFEGKNIPSRFDNNCDGVPRMSSRGVPDFNSVYESYKAGRYRRMDIAELWQNYYTSFVVRKNVIAVTKPTERINMSPGCAFAQDRVNFIKYYGLNTWLPSPEYTTELRYPQPQWNGSSVLAYNFVDSFKRRGPPNEWLCSGFSIDGDFRDYFLESDGRCKQDAVFKTARETGTYYLQPDDTDAELPTLGSQRYSIDYFLSEDPPAETCTLQYVSYILITVIICNMIKVSCMSYAACLLWDIKEPIFATIGDAVASYMERPDETTKDWCLIDHTKSHFWHRANADNYHIHTYGRKPFRRLFSATSKTRWFTTISICLAYLLTGIALLQACIMDTQGRFQGDIWKLKLGETNQFTLLGMTQEGTLGLMNSVLIANSFQLALSTTYFLYNALYTAQCGALEWASYVSEHKSLRVTWPRGQQRSTYYLHLPFRYGIPLTGFLMLLHFFISQSVFLVRAQWYDFQGQKEENKLISDIGYSPIAILVTICIGGGLIIAQILHSLRRLDNRIPIHGNQSVVISAMCHPRTDNHDDNFTETVRGSEDNIALQKVIWGAVKQPKGHEFGHCSFTAGSAELPVRLHRYM